MKTAPHIVAIDHVQLAMPPGREDAAREFYVGILGLTEVPKPPLLAARGGCWFESGNVGVHLGVESDFRPATKAHPAFLVAGLRELIVRCRQAKHHVIDDPLPGCARAYVHDPFGNRLELMEPEAV
jgi:catechol 2,3-dioxygenase-like lactoylglutathione lyase family enzyme